MENICSPLKEIRKLLLFLFIGFTVLISPAQNLSLNNSGKKESAFIKNQGQIIDQAGKANPQVLYLLNTSGLNVQLKKNGFSYDTYEPAEKLQPDLSPVDIFNKRKIGKTEEKRSRKLFHRIDFEFVDSNPLVEISELEESAFFQNFYNVPRMETGVTGVRSFKRIYYREIYRGIDVEFFVPDDPAKPVEYNFIVHPAGKIEHIRLKISGAKVICTPQQLELTLIHGTLSEIIPASWNSEGKQKNQVLITYIQLEENIFGFKYADDTQKNKNSTLTIDPTPVRQWATYFGGEQNESYFVGDVAIDSRGNSVISGYTQSTKILGTGGPPESFYETQAFTFIAKFNPEGTLLWTTYYGGSLSALFRSITIDKDDNIIGVGDASSLESIATPGTHQPSLYPGNNENYPDGMIVKFDRNGNRIWGTYFGGESFDGLTGVTTDEQGNIFTIGTTASKQNISTPGSFKEIGDADVHHKWNGILARFTKDGNLVWATYYGGEHTSEIAIDNDGNIYFVGDTYSRDEIATPGAHREDFLGTTWNEAFIAKFTPGGNRIWGTYFGGFDYDFGEGLVIDSKNNVIISGATRSEHIATPGAHKETKATVTDWDSFLAKFDSAGNLTWSTFYGGDGGESFYYNKVDVDINDNIYLFGNTGSENGISTPDGFQTEKAEGSDVFLAKFNPTGNRIWGTYYGGNSSDMAVDLEVNALGEIYLIGWTYSTAGISTPGAHQVANGGLIDAFLVKFKDCLSGISAEAPAGVCEGEDINLKASGGTSYLWTGPNGFNSTLSNPVISAAPASASGTYYAFISSGTDCDETLEFEVVVSPAPIAYPIEDTTACEDLPGSGIATFFNLTNLEARVVQAQTGMVVSWYDEAGKLLAAPSATYKNNTPHRETFILRVANSGNPSCYAETSFDLIIQPLPSIIVPQDLIICDNDTDGFANFQVGHLEKEITGNDQALIAKFLNSAGEELDFSESFQNTEAGGQPINVQVINKNTGCYREFDMVLRVQPAPTAHGINDIIGCDDDGDGISEYFDISGVASKVLQGQSGLELSYFKSDGSQIPNFSSPYTNKEPYEETITVRLTNPGSGCYAETLLHLKTSAAPILKNPPVQYTCDDGSGIGRFDTAAWEQEIIGNQPGLKLTWYDGGGNTLPSPMPAIYRNRLANSEILTVKVENATNPLCNSEAKLKLVVNKSFPVNLQDSYVICDLEPFLELSLPDDFDTWEWKFQDGRIISATSQVILREEGNYSLIVGKIENGILCRETRSFRFKRSIPPSIVEVNSRGWSSQNFIEIIAGGEGDFEFSIDGINYVDSNYFENLQGGIYQAYVRDKNGCGMASTEVVLLDYPKFFTPNNDGHNDLWQIKGFSSQSETQVFIYDRFGKLLKELSSHKGGWDGTFNGMMMPADDYWFTVQLEDGRIFKNHFSLLR